MNLGEPNWTGVPPEWACVDLNEPECPQLSILPFALYCERNVLRRKKICPFLFVKKVLSKSYYENPHNDLSEMCSFLVGKTLDCQIKGLWFQTPM